MKNRMNAIKFLMACMAIAIISACGDKNEDPKPDPEPEVVTANVSYNYACAPDLLLMAQLSVTYTGADGKEITEVITSPEWNKNLKGITPPFTANMRITFTKNDDFTPEKESYKFGESYNVGYKTSSNKENYVTNSGSTNVAKDKTLNHLDSWIKNKRNYSIEVKL